VHALRWRVGRQRVDPVVSPAAKGHTVTVELTRSAERALVAGPLVRGASELALVRASVSAADFADQTSRVVFEAECKVADAGRDITVTSVAGALESMGSPIGIEQLRQLAAADLPGERADLMARVVNAARVRITARRAGKLAELGQTPEALADPDRYLASVARVADEAARHVKRDAITAKASVLAGMTAWENRGRKLRAAPFGLRPLDDLLGGGLEPKRYVLIGARQGVGKTALAVQAMYNMAARGHPQLMFTLEMPVEDVVGRAICQRLSIDNDRWRKGPPEFDRYEAESIYKDALHLAQLPVTMYADESDAGTQLAKARVWLDTIARPIVEAGPTVESKDGTRETALVPVVWLDYIQLATLSGKFDTRDQQLGEMGRLQKEFANKEACAFVAIAALNRSNAKEKRPPTSSDLRECGALEYHANIIMLPHRESGAPTEDQPGRVVEQDAMIILDKNREGQVGRVKLTWKGPSQKFVVPAFVPRGGYENTYDERH
jgi:replicative DNA helicase